MEIDYEHTEEDVRSFLESIGENPDDHDVSLLINEGF
jgi:hypothetical protein